MNRALLWNDLAKKGLLLGLLLALSLVIENRLMTSTMGLLPLYGIYLIEWLVVVVAHYLMLHYYTKSYGSLFGPEEGFSFGRAYNYVLLLSLFAGVVVALVQVVYLHYIVGYENYIEQLVAALQRQLSGQEFPASVSVSLQQSFSQMKSQPEPSVLTTAFGAIFNTLFFGIVYGLIVAGVLSRRPRLFDNQA